jgi:formylglycine-generating enzyme required for sulfatase activity
MSIPHYQIRKKYTAKLFVENIGGNTNLDMILIPGGIFQMGSPENEIDRYPDESPQHAVTISSFFMGKYPITQAQWRVVANLPKVNQEISSEPSHFSGDNLPVEQVSWFEAEEFCARLSRITKRTYRLPSEAEWEYACRAGTNTPFHFGETITTDLANYRGVDNNDWSGSYGLGPKGIFRKETTTVGTFFPNTFGLYDMHGSIWEWCLDHKHDDYRNAPTDGSAWIDLDADQNAIRMLRGGSWIVIPRNCRSACRNNISTPDFRNYIIGFRVVCITGKT